MQKEEEKKKDDQGERVKIFLLIFSYNVDVIVFVYIIFNLYVLEYSFILFFSINIMFCVSF